MMVNVAYNNKNNDSIRRLTLMMMMEAFDGGVVVGAVVDDDDDEYNLPNAKNQYQIGIGKNYYKLSLSPNGMGHGNRYYSGCFGGKERRRKKGNLFPFCCSRCLFNGLDEDTRARLPFNNNQEILSVGCNRIMVNLNIIQCSGNRVSSQQTISIGSLV